MANTNGNKGFQADEEIRAVYNENIPPARDLGRGAMLDIPLDTQIVNARNIHRNDNPSFRNYFPPLPDSRLRESIPSLPKTRWQGFKEVVQDNFMIIGTLLVVMVIALLIAVVLLLTLTSCPSTTDVSPTNTTSPAPLIHPAMPSEH